MYRIPCQKNDKKTYFLVKTPLNGATYPRQKPTYVKMSLIWLVDRMNYTVTPGI